MYFPLKDREIRLLRIDPPLDSDALLKCSVQTVSLDGKPEYVALSYVWGDASITTNILLNDELFAATVNLASALRQIRELRTLESMNPVKDLPALLWVDAICINQNDISERSSQVRHMGDIYQNAVKVLSWLGPEADGSMEVISTTRNMSQEIQTVPPNCNRFDWLSRYPDLLEVTPFDENNSKILKCFNLFWERDYWKRIWIKQEIVLARDILLMCGAETISWEQLEVVCDWFSDPLLNYERPACMDEVQWVFLTAHGHPLYQPTPIFENRVLRKMWHHPQREAFSEPGSYIKTLVTYSQGLNLDCHDPRDKVYGLLSITDLSITADYSKSVRDVYIDATLDMFRLCGLSLTLSIIGKACPNAFNLPSWVRDWSNPSQDLLSRNIVLNRAIDEAGELRLFLWEPEAPFLLTVVGKRIGEVRDLEPKASKAYHRAWDICKFYMATHSSRLSRSRTPPLQSLLRLLFNNEDPLQKPEGKGEIQFGSAEFCRLGGTFIRVMCDEGEYGHLDPVESLKETLKMLGLTTAWDFDITFDQQTPGESSERAFSGRQQVVLAMMNASAESCLTVSIKLNNTLHGHLVFRTENNAIGVGPDSTLEGDIVCLFGGCSIPLILRQERKFDRLVGACAVYGPMVEKVRTEIQDELKKMKEGVTTPKTTRLEAFPIH
jgi:hypothetical protein